MRISKLMKVALAALALCSLACGSNSNKAATDQASGPGSGSATGDSKTTPPKADNSQTGTPGMHKKHYEKYLGKNKGDIKEKTHLDIGDWRFFSIKAKRRGSGGYRAAVNSAGLVVAPRATKKNLHSFLATEGMDGDAALQRLAWLLSAQAVPADAPNMPDDVKAVLTAPVVDKQGDAMRFVGWVANPPAVKDPVRMEMVAPNDDDVTVQMVNWQKVASGAQ